MVEFGHFFKRKTGIDVNTCSDILEIEKIIEEKNKQPLSVDLYKSNLVAAYGNIFPVVNYDEQLDKMIELQIDKIRGARDQKGSN